MEPRARIQTAARRVALTAALGALLAPAAAQAAPAATAAKSKSKPPVVTKVAPMTAAIGDKIRIHGRNFRRGKARNSVVFKRDGARAVFVRADLSTLKVMTVKLPETLVPFLRVSNGAAQPTKFRLRVLSSRLGRRFTSLALSPTIGPVKPKDEGAAPGAAPAPSASLNPDGDCDGDGQLNGVDADDDNDLLPDATETPLKLDGCKVDTDGDGVQDGYEYRSALDLNDSEDEAPNTFLPYPGKRPYPNPLDGTDAGVDFDGDSLTLADEHALWLYSTARGAARSLDALSYSDGEQYTRSARGADGRRVPTLAAAGYDKHQCFLDWADPGKEDACVTGEVEHGYLQVALQDPTADWFAARSVYDIRDFDRSGGPLRTGPEGDFVDGELTYYDHDGNGWLSDDERDEDADGLTNFQEARQCMRPEYWKGLYFTETPYYRAYKGTDLADEDSDGDGVRDGADDQDGDDVPNLMECSRNAASGRALEPRVNPPAPNPVPLKGMVNPFNPCVPAVKARTCNSRPPLESPWAPFNAADKYYYVWN